MESVNPSSTKWKEQKEKRGRALLPLADLFKLSFFDDLGKSRHSGGNRSPDAVPAEAGSHSRDWIPVFTGNPGFRPGSDPGFAGMTEIHLFRLVTRTSSLGLRQARGISGGTSRGFMGFR